MPINCENPKSLEKYREYQRCYQQRNFKNIINIIQNKKRNIWHLEKYLLSLGIYYYEFK